MQLNKIYRYYGIPTAQAYAQLKEKFTEAFTGFDGVSFETVEAADETTEKYNIYLDSDKSTWLTIYTENNAPEMSVSFKDGTTTVLSQVGSARTYRQINIVRTAYGVAFSNIGTTTTGTDILGDNYLTGFFVAGSPNVFAYTLSTSNTGGTSNDYMFSSSHQIPEIFNNYSTLNSTTVPRTKLFSVSSLIQPVDCEHLFRVAFTDGKTGRVKIEDRYFIMGTRYALEYIP